MALYLVTVERTFELHVGTSFSLARTGLIFEDIVEVQADGHELEWVRKNFTNLPCSNFRVCNWYGDIAKTIVAGLYYLDK